MQYSHSPGAVATSMAVPQALSARAFSRASRSRWPFRLRFPVPELPVGARPSGTTRIRVGSEFRRIAVCQPKGLPAQALGRAPSARGGSLGPRPHGPGPRRLGESARSDPPGRASESASGDAQAADSTPHKLPAPKSTFRRALETPRPRWHVAQQSHGRIVGSGCHRPFKLPSEQRTVAGKLRRAAASASCQPWPDVQHNTARWLIRDSTQVGCKYVLRGAF